MEFCETKEVLLRKFSNKLAKTTNERSDELILKKYKKITVAGCNTAATITWFC